MLISLDGETKEVEKAQIIQKELEAATPDKVETEKTSGIGKYIQHLYSTYTCTLLFDHERMQKGLVGLLKLPFEAARFNYCWGFWPKSWKLSFTYNYPKTAQNEPPFCTHIAHQSCI